MQHLNINRGSSLQAQAMTMLHVTTNENKNKLEHRVPITKCLLLALLPSDRWVGHGTAFPQHQLHPLERDRETKEVSDRSAWIRGTTWPKLSVGMERRKRLEWGTWGGLMVPGCPGVTVRACLRIYTSELGEATQPGNLLTELALRS